MGMYYGWCLLLVCSFKVLVLFQPPLCCFQSISLKGATYLMGPKEGVVTQMVSTVCLKACLIASHGAL